MKYPLYLHTFDEENNLVIANGFNNTYSMIWVRDDVQGLDG